MSTTRIEQEQVNSSLPFQRLVGRTRATEGSGDSYLCATRLELLKMTG